jgi:gamma-glutamyltranspeptidase / glutathione hydrolase
VTKGVVAAGDPQTAEAGAVLLREGGNAIDAIVAAAFAAFVCELPLCSPLGGGVLVLEQADGVARAFDMFARTPGLGGKPAVPSPRVRGGPSSRDFEAVSVSFGAASQIFHVGRASVAMPLALAGLLDVHRRYGVRPLRDVLAPAIALGRNGYVLGPGLAFVFRILEPIVARTAACRALFADAHGATATAGMLLHNHDMASTFELLARKPETMRDIYAALAREMSTGEGGLFTDADIASLGAADRVPVTITHRGWQLATMPAPSTGGVLVALGLRLLENVSAAPFLSPEHVVAVARAQEALLAERDADFAARCADPERVRAMLSDEAVLRARAHARNPLGSTTHLSAIDEHGNAVALTLTNGEGCGHVVTGTGMIPNNMLGEEDLHPRGFHVDPPGAPLMTMMAPTLLSRGTDRVALGSGGSNRLRTAILQVLVALVEFGRTPEEAVHAPRLHVERNGEGALRVAFETQGLPEPSIAALRSVLAAQPAVFTEPNLYFGGVHLAMRQGGTFEGVGDARRSGARVVT